jgi:hypothetical protein
MSRYATILAAAAVVAGPRVMIFDAKKPKKAPQVLVAPVAADAVPMQPILSVTIGEDVKGRPTSVSVEEKAMILDAGQTATPPKE